MAAKVEMSEPGSFSQIVDVVEKFQEAHPVAWYRGCGKSNYILTPTLYRHTKIKDPKALADLEKELASVFAQRSPPFVTQAFSDEWDRLFFMQHYGIPTRLLDWTESPFVALYFALTTCPRDDSGNATSDASVWLLNPAAWNKGALNDISFPGGVLDASRQPIKSYSAEIDLAERKNTPIMVYGTHNSPRIVAQRGMFALFGKSTEPMEKQYLADTFDDGILQIMTIKKVNVNIITESLLRKGISDSTVYPDLVGLSLELRRSFGF